MRKWKRRYKGFVITHDPYGVLACYWEKGPLLDWMYLGSSLDVIKFNIGRMVTE